MSEETAFALIKFTGAICVIPFAILIYMAIFQVERHDTFVTLATRDHRTNPFQDTPLSRLHPRRLWRIIFLLMAWGGGGYTVFGLTFALVAWMPDDWRIWQWEGQRVSTAIAISCATTSMFFLPLWWDWLVERSRERLRFENSKEWKP